MNQGGLLLIGIMLIFVGSRQNLAYEVNFSYDQTQQTLNTLPKNANAMDSNQSKSPFLLEFLYKNFFGTLIRRSLTQKWFSIFAGWYCNRSFSKFHIKSFIKHHAIAISDAKNGCDEFRSFNDFFIRKLKPEARPIDPHPDHIISPADGKVIIITSCTKSMRFPVKHSDFNLEQFLGCTKLTELFDGGTIMIFRLAPHDYHRFHFPLDCIPLTPQIIHGRYESVNPLVYYMGIQPLTENERHLTLLATKGCGNVALISVGALCVGKIIETYIPHQWHKKGDEAGYFCFGGSTLVLIFKKGILEVEPEIIRNSQEGNETPILMGQKIAKIIA